MDHMVGGDLPALAWKRFMSTAEDGLPIRGFAAAEATQTARAANLADDARRDFYGALADQFDQTAEGDAPLEAPRPDDAP